MYSTLTTILSFIQTNLADAVTIVENANSITITDYKVLKIFSDKSRQYPSISIIPDETDPMEESAGNRSFFGNPSKRDDTLTIWVWDRGNTDDANTIETTVVGYMDALEELFEGDYELSGVKGVEILTTRYTDLFPDLTAGNASEGLTPLLKGAFIQIKVKYNIL